MEDVPAAFLSSQQRILTAGEKQRYQIAILNSSMELGHSPKSLTTLTLMLQSQFVGFLLITQTSVPMCSVFQLASIGRQGEAGGGVSVCGT